jgi:hypothetical protein
MKHFCRVPVTKCCPQILSKNMRQIVSKKEYKLVFRFTWNDDLDCCILWIEYFQRYSSKYCDYLFSYLMIALFVSFLCFNDQIRWASCFLHGRRCSRLISYWYMCFDGSLVQWTLVAQRMTGLYGKRILRMLRGIWLHNWLALTCTAHAQSAFLLQVLSPPSHFLTLNCRERPLFSVFFAHRGAFVKISNFKI